MEIKITKQSDTFWNFELADGRMFSACDHVDNAWLPSNKQVQLSLDWNFMSPKAQKSHQAFFDAWGGDPQRHFLRFSSLEDAAEYVAKL